MRQISFQARMEVLDLYLQGLSADKVTEKTGVSAILDPLHSHPVVPLSAHFLPPSFKTNFHSLYHLLSASIPINSLTASGR
jgi:hypothetical protein